MTGEPRVRLELTVREAERLYLAASVYEATVHRVIADPDIDLIATSALTKVAQGIVDARPDDEEHF